jgi:hypothetical protein
LGRPNATPQILDPCPLFGTPEDPPDCRYDQLYAVRDGVWAAHVVQTAQPQVQTLRRYDGATRTMTLQVDTPVLEVP